VDTNDKGNTINSTSIVASHKVTLYYIWASWCPFSEAFHPTVSSIYQRYKNHSLEIIGFCHDGTNNPDALNMIESYNMEWPTLLSNPGVISFTGFPTIMAFDENGKLIFHSSVTSRNLLPDFLKEILGEGDLPYESSDFSEDGKVYTLQKASEGNGINVVLMGDAFSDRQVADGTYEKVMRTAADAFFSEEPYASFRNLFNVYYVTAVSQNEGYIDGGSTAFSGYFGSGTHVGGDNNKCMQYASTCPGMTGPLMNEVLIIVMMNSAKYAGTCYFGTGTAYQGDYGRGYGIAYFPIGTSDEELACVLHHEAGGHGFAKLLDEYYYESQGTIPLSEISDNINSRNHYGWGRNVDYTSDPNSVVWSKFISDSRYASEGIGVFEGACTYYKGAYRPTETSIMDANVGGFNAPSREAIYNRIHKLAYGESWQFDYEEFVGWDLNRQGRSRSISVQAKHEPTAPPVILNQHWENGRLVAN
jgi:thiol-disulfide isomerase/thioredoxin